MRRKQISSRGNRPLGFRRSTDKTADNNVLIRSGEAPAIGWSRNMLYSGLNILHRSVVRRQTGFAARITRTLSTSRFLYILEKSDEKQFEPIQL